MFTSGDIDAVTLKRISIGSSPAFDASIKHHKAGSDITQSVIVDSGCTGECIISQKFANTISAEIEPSPVRNAKLADKETCLPIVGMTHIDGNFKGNSFTLNALVSRDGDPVLLGIPAAEKLGLIIDAGNKKLTFPNGVSVNYRSNRSDLQMSSVQVRRLLLRSPRQQTLLPPGSDVQLTVNSDVPDGRFAVQPHKQSREVTQSQSWLTPDVLEISANKVTVVNTSLQPFAVARKDNVAEAFPMVNPDLLPSTTVEATDANQQKIQADETSWREIILDPDCKLSAAIKAKFTCTNKSFAAVFQSDLPKYNGAFGRVEAVINVPDNLPQSTRLKEVPWYPKKMLWPSW